MGADGTVEFYDADAIDAAKLRALFFSTFANPRELTLHGHRYYTTYWDTEHHDELRDEYDPEARANRDLFAPFSLAVHQVWT